MEVILTTEAPDGTQSTVRAAAGSYEEAKASAEAPWSRKGKVSS
ncbi:hypothetical protein [Arthrobacter bambusae]|nr:hypothetical protein [Arthrobacter bambusae]MDQ0212126.1 hypothetical protein [Arthrobacter bambusae]MDQ0236656.1 hypothetical protein [Arthrobacter bambusae]